MSITLTVDQILSFEQKTKHVALTVLNSCYHVTSTHTACRVKQCYYLSTQDKKISEVKYLEAIIQLQKKNGIIKYKHNNVSSIRDALTSNVQLFIFGISLSARIAMTTCFLHLTSSREG